MFFTRTNTRRGGNHLSTSTTTNRRRAFRPEGDNLEGRQLLSTLGTTAFIAPHTPASTFNASLQTDPTTTTSLPSGTTGNGYQFPALTTTPSGVHRILRGVTPSSEPTTTTGTGTGYQFPALMTMPSGVHRILR